MTQAFDARAQQAVLESRAETALELARRLGADACEVGASVDQGTGVSVREGDVESVELSRDQGIAVTVYLGKRKGSASSTDASDASIKSVVEKAIAIARYTGEDPASGLADAELMATELPDLDVHHPWALDTDKAIELALACEAAGLAEPGIRSSDGASLSSGEGVRVYANSHGFLGSQRGSRHSLSCLLIAEDASGMQRDYDYTSARDPRALRDPAEVGRSAAERTLQRLGGQRPQTGRFPVMFDPTLASGLIGHLMSALAGGAIYRDASFLCGRLGETLFPEWFSLAEQPMLVGGMASSPFDGDGVQTRNNRFIEQGRLASYMLSAYSARRLGMQTTANAGGARNLRLEAPLESREALLSKMDRGVLVTELMGQGVNGVTGDYSRGAAGFWVENGQIQHPVEEFTIAGNLAGMFQGLVGLGDDIDTRGSIHSGSWLIDEMTIAGS
ncbi:MULTISPECIES: metalloprotease PmbA [unclassified Halomonas]|uniref:Metalloprotease PmbA n=1 Tax=Halomonas sp. H10-59 TaxID=2950874 RepID=A0AAU7KQ69_9GAMM|nr:MULTISPECIES: metalloprotease PmbA [unclassified Halomonas]MBS8267465.1 metalloprotease PmbA [Halomonas litopenaei]KJZ12936.1 peptidase PmbA [Halomonas sp. S2151]MBY5942750.1 metalloprotease PmbA [Halomonas sp. DP5N14-9]MBY6111473.1 metalloprotease PmbA [Halomonas sp. DP1Y21-3]MCO7217614.1 metalloprotease PmbA [Halomonas sp. OfavH-34-E]